MTKANGVDLIGAALDEALEDEVKVLFKTLVTGLIDNAVEDGGEKATLGRFAKGLRTVLRARTLVEKVVADVARS